MCEDINFALGVLACECDSLLALPSPLLLLPPHKVCLRVPVYCLPKLALSQRDAGQFCPISPPTFPSVRAEQAEQPADHPTTTILIINGDPISSATGPCLLLGRVCVLCPP
mmetsp:Transcript_55196/g.120824  ORF Transcript_55196/g.120824 Transcript_55196/m.120824 type:complete len:111 (-) Transcript_55196:11-343(-)